MKNNPQIALKNQASWAVIGPYWRETGMTNVQMPAVSCPIVDTCHAKSEDVTKIVKRFVEIEGVKDVDLFITELMAIGCVMTIPVGVHEFSITMPSRV